MADDKGKEKKRRYEHERLLHRLQQMIYNNYLLSLRISGVKKAISDGNDGFFFAHDDTANKEMNKMLSDMAKQMDYLLLNGIEREWNRGEETFWDKLQLTFSKSVRDKKAFDQIREQATQSARDNTAKAFYNQKRDGFSVSDRVWNLAGNAKKEMEIIIQNGIKEGKGADEIQKSLKDYLNEPDRLFRRVRNKETGELELCKAAQKYKPGRGVYRSAYKNAMRLARTELKAANCEAAWNSAQNNPLITGWKIVLSNNHTTLINGVPTPFKDICDKLQGTYPKTFKFKGWHPQCRCIMNPMLMSDDEYRRLVAAEDKGEEYTPKQITKIPEEFTEWVEQNQERAKGWSNMPRFIKDNAQFVKTKFDVNSYSDEEKKFTQARKTALAMQRVQKELKAMYPKVESTELAAIHHYTRGGGNYRQLNKQLFKDTLTDFSEASSSLISKGLSGLTTVHGSVYRGAIMKQREYEALYSGSTVMHKIFTSTSTDLSVAIGFATYRNLKKNEVQVIFDIQSKNGKDISQISEFNGTFDHKNQKEVLFDKNTRFEIQDSYVDFGGTHWIKLIEK